MIVYVDDIVVTGDDLEVIVLLKKSLSKEFEIKDLGVLKYFLGIEVARSKYRIFISQRKYVLNLMQETGMLGCKSNDTLIDLNLKLDKDPNGTLVDRRSYQRLVGKLIYLSHTRSDFAYAVSLVSQFMHAPESHLEVVLRILRYLKYVLGKGIVFREK